ncbi:hypothetical protein [Zooshikella sp. RANM57]|uniref:hypothetical protein n=1 Tax=Zooshikella sp. RANM57 TaxID=3425863 RepID=UPI003D6DE63D
MTKPWELILISDWGEECRQQSLEMLREGYISEKTNKSMINVHECCICLSHWQRGGWRELKEHSLPDT